MAYLSAAECQKKYKVQRGDVYRIEGKHRLMCGNGQDEADLNVLLEGKRVDAVITDPPYLTTQLHFDQDFSLDFIQTLLRYVRNDGYLAAFSSIEMLAEIAKVWVLRFSGAWFKNAPYTRLPSAKKPPRQTEIYAVFAHPKHKIKNLTWNTLYRDGLPYRNKTKRQNSGGSRKERLIGPSSLTPAFETYVIDNQTGDRIVSDALWGRIKQSLPYVERTPHPTQKPVDVLEVLVQWLTNENDLILDPFAGSGSTLFAGHGHRRIVYSMDISPEYVAVTLDKLERNNMSFEKV